MFTLKIYKVVLKPLTQKVAKTMTSMWQRFFWFLCFFCVTMLWITCAIDKDQEKRPLSLRDKKKDLPDFVNLACTHSRFARRLGNQVRHLIGQVFGFGLHCVNLIRRTRRRCDRGRLTLQWQWNKWVGWKRRKSLDVTKSFKSRERPTFES